MKISCVTYGSRLIDYRVEYSDRKTLGITVTPDMEVIVRAPEHSTDDRIGKQVLKKALWILRQLSYFLSFRPIIPPRRYVSGETHPYLGRQYRLRVIPGRTEDVRLHGKFIEVHTPDKENVKHLLDEWYLDHARIRFHVIARPLIERFRKYDVSPAKMEIREMTTCWGSCTPKGRIILNPLLIKKPRPCIEYVIMHELCHLVHHSHNAKFLALQSKEMPDWEKWKERLERGVG
jgi:predicted metal-dependent hydrolase